MILAILCLTCGNCSKDSDTLFSTPGSIVFGRFYGFCHGESCIEIFKLEEGKLYEDVRDGYPSAAMAYEGEFIILPDSLFQKVSDLEELFPGVLRDIPDTVVGCPDCADGGGIYLEVNKDSFEKYWLIDLDPTQIPFSLHELVAKVSSKIDMLQ